MRRSLLRFLGLAVLGVAVFYSLGLAATGAATQYEVKIKQFDLYNGTNWITVYSGLSGSLDIASVSGSNQFVGSFLSGLNVPDGTYSKCKVTPATTFRIKGTISGYNTTSATTDDGNGRTVSVASNSGSATSCDVTILDSDVAGVGSTEQDFSTTPIIVTGGVANHKVRVYFDVSAALTLAGAPGSEIIYPNPPSVTISIE